MKLKVILSSALLLVLLCTRAHAISYTFVVTCADGHKVIFTVRYGAIDPGKEYARVIAAKKLAPFHQNSCGAREYKNAADCPECPREEFVAASLSGDELSRLAAGDPTVIPEVIIGIPLRAAGKIGDVITGKAATPKKVYKRGEQAVRGAGRAIRRCC
jgi:hypothetical protein